MKRALLIVTSAILVLALYANADDKTPTEVSLCQLIGHPEQFDKRKVSGIAVYVIGPLRHPAILSEDCPNKSHVGVRLAPSFDSDSRQFKRLLNRAEKAGVRVHFVGTFRNEYGVALDDDMAIVIDKLEPAKPSPSMNDKACSR